MYDKFIQDSDGYRIPLMQLDGSIPVGTNNIGNVDLASAIPAGTNLIGKVGIDQTTPGTTNKVVAELSGSTLEEQKIETDAVDGVVTFTNDISIIEIFNTDDTNAGVFTVNGINLHVPTSQVFKAKIGGTVGKTVTITGATTYIISTYV